ncbi:hypothetical protein CPC08DRAFT_757693 [Agrocybe pediades]|nr:hypothetical protein CPC08DRAFT_757693 [Agrocybe pediades]
MSTADSPPIHLVGTQAFFPSLLAYIRNLSATAFLPLDNVIFQSILLCLIAGDKHLILRTPEEDVGLTVKLALWTLSSIFNLSTQKVKIRKDALQKFDSPSANPTAFLGSLFLSNPAPQDDDKHSDNVKHFGHHRQQSSRSSRHKSRSIPNNLAGVAQAHGTPESPILRPQPRYAHAYTDPLPLPSKTHRKTTLQLPQALVISGLEDASDTVQRTFSKVLADKKIDVEALKGASGLHSDDSNTSHLPEGFLAIYVCPWHATQRPSIHKSLLDKFAMSTNVYISQTVRRDFQSLPFSPVSRTYHANLGSYSTPGSPLPSSPANLPPTHTPPIATKSLPLTHRPPSHHTVILPDIVLPWTFIKSLQEVRSKTHISYTLSLYISDIFSATRHNSLLNALLLTARSMKDAEDLIRVSRVIGNDLTGMELVRSSPMTHHHQRSHSDGGSFSDNESTDPMLEDYVRLADERNSAMSSSHPNDRDHEEAYPLTLDVSEVDIARIVPRVISHRVSLRDGPRDEILSSALFGATFTPKTFNTTHRSDDGENVENVVQGTARQAQSVKDVLVNILAEV